MPFSTTHASSSASSPFHSRSAPVPIVLRGPEKDSRRYITQLPRTLDGLLIKARSLFPVPPGNTPYITLDADEQTVILEDAIPFLREREVLVFRWAPDTPRKCSGNRVKWDESVGVGVNPATHAQSQTQTSTSTSASALAPPPTPAPSSSSSSRPTPTRPFSAIHQQQQRTQAHLHRAAHVKRVLEEQRRQREQEQEQEEQDSLEDAHSRADDMDHTVDDTPLSASSVGNTAQDEPVQQQQPQEVDPTSVTATAIPETHPTHPTIFMSSMTQSDLEVSGSSPPPYSSPHAPTTTAPAHHTRCTTPDQGQDSGSDDGPPSSPLVSSPTRDVHAAVLKTSMSPHGAQELIAGRSPDCVRPIEEPEEEEQEVAADKAAEEENVQPASTDDVVEHEAGQDGEAEDTPEDEAMNSDDELECNDLLQSTPPQANSPLREEADVDVAPPATHSTHSADCDKLYRTMSAVIANLQNHPSNVSLRDGLAAEFHSFAQDSGDSAVDLQIISEKLQQRAYGTNRDALSLFRRDLKRLWTLVRDFYGPRSAHGQCATVLDKFAEVVLNEWKGRSGSGGGSGEGGQRAVSSQPAAGVKRKLSSSTSSKDDAKSSSAAARQRAAAVMASFQQQQGRRTKAAKRTAGVRKVGTGGAGAGGTGNNELNWPDMMAFHRAIMGGDEKKKQAPMQMQMQPVEKNHAVVVPPQDVVVAVDSDDDELSSAPPSPAPAAQKSKPTTFTAAAAAATAGVAAKETNKTAGASPSPSSRGRRGSRRASRVPRRYAGESVV